MIIKFPIHDTMQCFYQDENDLVFDAHYYIRGKKEVF